jgi:hypothetical protein
MNKDWLNDFRVGCKSPSNSLSKVIKIDVDLEEELEMFEGAFEKDEVVEMQKSMKNIVSNHFFKFLFFKYQNFDKNKSHLY